MWILSDFFYNLFFSLRLFFLINFFPKKFKNNNEKEKVGWNLTFSDEFENGTLDREVWRTDAYFGLRFNPERITDKNEPPYQYFSDDCFEFDDSVLKQLIKNEQIEIDYTDFDGVYHGKWEIPYQVGQIDSSKSFSQKYGYFEIRSKITSEPGAWPAFWLASTESWPPEIDIYEMYTEKNGGVKSFHSNFHWNYNGKRKWKSAKHKVKNTSEDFHIYAVEWNKKSFKIYYDNILVRVFSNPKALKFFKHKMHIIINAGVREGIENANFPSYHEIDYIRAYGKIEK